MIWKDLLAVGWEVRKKRRWMRELKSRGWRKAQIEEQTVIEDGRSTVEQ